MELTLHTTPSGKSFASKSKEACKVYCQPRHVRRTRRGGWREALTSEMLRSVVIDILIALLVILFRTVLFPLSSPRSPNLLDESQEAVHDWLPGPRRAASSSRAHSPAALQVGGAWMTLRKPRDRDTLASSLSPCAHRGHEFSLSRRKHNSNMGVPWWDFSFSPRNCQICWFFLRMGGAEAESKTINKSKIFKRKQTAKLVGFNLFPNQTKVQAVRLKQGVSQHWNVTTQHLHHQGGGEVCLLVTGLNQS